MCLGFPNRKDCALFPLALPTLQAIAGWNLQRDVRP